MAQPRWYRSREHELLTREALASFPTLAKQNPDIGLEPPASFHALVDELRSKKVTIPALRARLRTFLDEI